MDNIHVRITDSKGGLVREFDTNSSQFADEHIAMWQRRYARCQPPEVLTVERSDHTPSPSRAAVSGTPSAPAREADDCPLPGAGLRPGSGRSTGGRS